MAKVLQGSMEEIVLVILLCLLITASAFGHTIDPNPDDRVLTAHYNDLDTNCHVHEYEGGSSAWNIGENGKVAGIWDFDAVDDSYAQFPTPNVDINIQPPQNTPQAVSGGGLVSEPELTTEPIESSERPTVRNVKSSVCMSTSRIPKLEIIGLAYRKDLKSLLVTVRNPTRHFIRLGKCHHIVLENADGEIKVQATFFNRGRDRSFTYQKSRDQQNADTPFALTDKRFLGLWDGVENRWQIARFVMPFNFNTKRAGGYAETDSIALYFDDDGDPKTPMIEVSRYPKPENDAPSAPMKPQTPLTIQWAKFKRR